jgi:hypothetical protein
MFRNEAICYYLPTSLFNVLSDGTIEMHQYNNDEVVPTDEQLATKELEYFNAYKVNLLRNIRDVTSSVRYFIIL